ncbi:MAG: hypothetical protein HOP11_07495 [Saprospiraceae bacterium]|nr:hypothetical protein [Saprospiraceae bacterium]
MPARLQDINQAAAAGCATKVAGVKKIWIIDNLEVSAVTVTETATKAEVTAITLSAANKAFEMTFTQDNTAFCNIQQANAGDPFDCNIYFSYDGLSAEKIDMLNGLRLVCGLSAFVELASGNILFVGRDYDYTANTTAEITKALTLKGGFQSGLGNGDSEKVTFELVGQAKGMQLNTTLTTSALNAL